MTQRFFNFSPGPAMLPHEVLLEAKENLLSYNCTGLGIMEIGHRSSIYMELSEQTTQLLKELLCIGNEYEIIMMHGGARTQFSAVPLNFCNNNACYIVSGLWSEMAMKEAKNLVNTYTIKTMDHNFNWQTKSIPDNEKYDYIHYTPNETVHGILTSPPDTNLPIIADATSALLGIELQVEKHDLIYAAAQKNMGIAGITFVIIKKSLLSSVKPAKKIPSMLKYQNHIDSKSLYNTPTTFAVYISNLMFKWIKNQGGVSFLSNRNIKRSELLYQALESYPCYGGLVPANLRSPLNICFTLKDEKSNQNFLEKAKENGLYFLKGHSKVGGIRASIYNGMPDSGIESLIKFVNDYALSNQ